MPPRSSLNRYVGWGTVLPLLGVEVRSSALPARVACPTCTYTLQVYRDLAVGGQWYWCQKCRFAGDSIELAARVWRIGVDSAVLKLMAAGIPFPAGIGDAEIRVYLTDHIERRKLVEALWQEASAAQLPLDGELGAFARRLGIPAVRPRDWISRGGQFIGVTDRAAVLRCLQLEQAQENGSLKENSQRIFRGKGWGRLIVVPYRDLPGRIRGLLLIGREARYPEDFVFKRVRTMINDNIATVADCGVAMLEAILQPHKQFGDRFFVCTDLVEALRLQLAHLAEHGHPLPLAGAWGAIPAPTWEMLPRRPAIVFGPERTSDEAAALLRHARALPAEIGRVVAIRGQRPADVLRAAARAVTPWPAYLEDRLLALPAAEAEAVYLKSRLDRGESDRFLRECGPAARSRVRGVVDVDTAVQSVECGARTVVEANGVWRDARKGQLISDLIIRIDRIVHQRRRNRILYEGMLMRRGIEVPFTADQDNLDHQTPTAWLRRVCLEGGLGLPSIDHGWGRRLFQIAQSFREPSFVETEGTLGWDDDRNLFAFPRFTLAPGGVVSAAEWPTAEAQSGLRFDPPDGLTPGQIVRLSTEDESTRLLWAVTAVVAAGALAPCLGLEPTRAAFRGRAAIHILVPAATALGCPLIALSTTAATIARMLELRRYCNWPMVVSYRENWLGREAVELLPGVICRTSEWTADVLSLLGGWTIVDAATSDASVLPIVEHGPAMLPNYLKYFLEERPTLTGNLMTAVLADMASWFAGHGGSAHAVRRASAIIRPDDEGVFADRFADLVSRLFCEGDLTSIRADLGEIASGQPALTVLGDGRLHIPRAGIARALARRDTPHLDVTIVTRRLAAAGFLLDERDHDGHPGWVVPEPWWTDRLRRWRSREQTPFKKVD